MPLLHDQRRRHLHREATYADEPSAVYEDNADALTGTASAMGVDAAILN